jgi:hypothetical protein
LIEINRGGIAGKYLSCCCAKRAPANEITGLRRLINPICPAIDNLCAPFIDEEVL